MITAGWLSPHRLLHPLPPGAVRWTGGFWGDRFQLCGEAILPKMHEALEDPDNRARIVNFRIAAGDEQGAHTGTNWSDGDVYKWVEAMAHVYALTHDPALDTLMDQLIDLFSRAQDPDGYLCTQCQLEPKRGRWTDRRNHELYNFGHLFTAASVHKEATGKLNFVMVAMKAADHLWSVFGRRPEHLWDWGWNPSNIMGLVDLYRATGEERYRELAGTFVTMRGSGPRGDDQNQNRKPLRDETEAVGHAVTATYLYAGAADVYAETGDEKLRAALERVYDSISARRMYLTGGVGAWHHGAMRYGQDVHEAFGLDFNLPSATAYNETCANLGNAMFALRMLNLTGDARYADTMETVLYNSGLSAMSLDGERFRYTNPLRWHGEQHVCLSNDTLQRWRVHHCYCCPPQVARTIASLHRWACAGDATGVWVHLYGQSTIEVDLPDLGRLSFELETDYPWDGAVKLTITAVPTAEAALHLRIPGWCDGATIAVNGEAAGPAQPGTYVTLKRVWAVGETIHLNLPLEVQRVRSHPLVEETRNHVAIRRGPVVYCLEGIDLPDGVELLDVHLPRDGALEAVWESCLLGGVMTVQADAARLSVGEVDGPLYLRDPGAAPSPLTVKLIPYYAWENRGVSTMSVWLPLL